MSFSELSSKAPLVLIPLLFLPYSSNTQALSATTANTIQGTAPYIEQNGIKATDLNSLLSIKIGTKTYISNATGVMQEVGAGGVLIPVTTPTLTLDSAGDPFSSVSTLVPADGSSYVLNSATVIPLTNRKDDDNDGTFTIAGNIKGVWTDKKGQPIGTLTYSPTICNAPYTLTLSTDSTTPSISTQYGDPNSTTYGNSSAVFKIDPVTTPTVCFAKPDMTYADNTSTPGYHFAGPSHMWDTTNGFIPQSTTPATYGSNFPTTGANELYFDLIIEGEDATTLTWAGGNVNNIKVDIDPTFTITPTTVRYKLTGPTTAIPPAQFATTGSTFELAGKKGSITVIKYGFTIKKWYVNHGTTTGTATEQNTYCTGLGYRQSAVSDLTNASGTGGGVGGGVIPGATPGSGGNFYSRYIGTGLLSEWGDMSKYTDSGFESNSYWTSSVNGSNRFYAYSNYGLAGSSVPADNWRSGVCTHP